MSTPGGSLSRTPAVQRLPAPAAARLRRPSWRDPRLLVGLLLVAVAVVVGTTAVAAADGLPGKPAPDTFIAAARRLGVDPAEAVVVEDAVSGVAAGRAGNFGLVVGVDRGVGERALRDAGMDVMPTTPEQFQKTIAQEIKLHAELVKASGLVPQ